MSAIIARTVFVIAALMIIGGTALSQMISNEARAVSRAISMSFHELRMETDLSSFPGKILPDLLQIGEARRITLN
ncbi:MAG TPA: hypothetical protein VHN11_12065 [Xanthobacteraceae bacterium]|jgi:hypothetical protein|nr:hypothetical protein [Xanthobacteraceae bacterium]